MAQPKPLNPNYRDKGIKKTRGDRFAPAKAAANDTSLDYNGMSDEDRENDQRRSIIAKTVDDCIRDAVTARENSGIEETWAEDEDQYNGVDDLSSPYSVVKTRDQAPRPGQSDGRSKVFVPITKPKTDIGVARVSEMLLPNDDKPWDIEPTPVPDIDEALDAPATDSVTLGDGTQAPKPMVAQFLKDKAKEAAKKEADWIEDKFVEGMVYSEMRQVLRDAGRIGTGVLKGPHPVLRISQKWRNQAPESGAPANILADSANNPQVINRQQTETVLIRKESIEPTSTCVRVQDCYPDPSCGDNIHKGSFFVEREFLTGKALKALAFLPGYDPRAIVDCLKEGPRSYAKQRDPTFRRQPGDTNYDSKLFEVFNYYGDASPEDLELLMLGANPMSGAKEAPDADEDDAPEEASPIDSLLSKEDRLYLLSVPVIYTVVNGRPIKCTLNPMEIGGFPFDFFPWEPIKGQPYGRGIPRKMGVAQRMLNAGTRALMENAGLSAGPQIITTKGMIEAWNGNDEVTGRKGWYFTPNDSGIDDVRKAFMVINVESTQPQLSALIQYALDLCDLLTNLPMLMQGDQQANTSPETLGGLKMLFNNAMSPLRVIAKLFDDLLIVPHLKRYHDWAMEKGPDDIKGGDSQIKGKGSTTLIQREEGREFLAQVFPMKDDPTLRIDPAKLIDEMGRSNGFDMSSVQYTEEEWKQKQAEAAKSPPPQDPAVQAAQIRSQAMIEQEKERGIDNEKARQSEERIKNAEFSMKQAIAEVDRQIAEMNLSGQSGESLMKIKAMLATNAMDNRIKSDEMNLKLDPANQSHLGI